MNQPSKLVWPTRGQAYTLDVFEKLELRDSPCLRFYHNDRLVVIQDSPSGIDELCDNAGFAATEWTFVRETDEWIPVFQYSGKRPITDFVTIEEGAASNRTGEYWVCWKGFHRPELTPYQERQAERRFEADWDEARLIHTRQELLKKMLKPKPEEALKFIRAALAAHASADEFAQNHALALAYLEQRKADVKSFNEREVLTWINRNSGKYASIYGNSVVQEYTALEREKNPDNWGAVTVYKEGGQEDRIIQMKSYECLVAWILAKYW